MTRGENLLHLTGLYRFACEFFVRTEGLSIKPRCSEDCKFNGSRNRCKIVVMSRPTRGYVYKVGCWKSEKDPASIRSDVSQVVTTYQGGTWRAGRSLDSLRLEFELPISTFHPSRISKPHRPIPIRPTTIRSMSIIHNLVTWVLNVRRDSG